MINIIVRSAAGNIEIIAALVYYSLKPKQQNSVEKTVFSLYTTCLCKNLSYQANSLHCWRIQPSPGPRVGLECLLMN